MLKNAQIKNFQSIRSLSLDFGLITVIAGDSWSGKSAFFRACQAVTENRSGDDFITFKEKETIVSLDNIKWVQTKTKNEYYLDDELFEKCGRDTVPEKVMESLNMGIVEFGKDIKRNLNFYSQLGNIFLVQGKGSDNAKIVGSISNLDIVYNGLRDAEKDTRAIKTEMKNQQGEIDREEEQLEDLQDQFDKMDETYLTVKKIYEDTEKITRRMDELLKLRDEHTRMITEVKKIKEEQALYDTLDFDLIREKLTRIEGLKTIKREFVKAQGDLYIIEGESERFKSVLFNGIPKTLKRYESLLQVKSELLSAVSDLDRIKRSIKQANSDKKKYQKIWDELEVCGECGAEKEHWNIGVKG